MKDRVASSEGEWEGWARLPWLRWQAWVREGDVIGGGGHWKMRYRET